MTEQTSIWSPFPSPPSFSLCPQALRQCRVRQAPVSLSSASPLSVSLPPICPRPVSPPSVTPRSVSPPLALGPKCGRYSKQDMFQNANFSSLRLSQKFKVPKTSYLLCNASLYFVYASPKSVVCKSSAVPDYRQKLAESSRCYKIIPE